MHADHEKTMAHDFPLGMLWWCLLNGRASMQHVTGSSKQPGEHAATASALAQGFPDGGAMLVGWQSGQACAGHTLTVKTIKGVGSGLQTYQQTGVCQVWRLRGRLGCLPPVPHDSGYAKWRSPTTRKNTQMYRCGVTVPPAPASQPSTP